jgi:hypothetical protein
MAILKHGTSNTVMQRLRFPNRSARWRHHAASRRGSDPLGFTLLF